MRVAVNDIWRWSAANNFSGSATKLVNEANEFAAEPSLEEAADVLISLGVACQQLGWTPDDLIEAVEAKMLVNRHRTWALSGDGTYQHI